MSSYKRLYTFLIRVSPLSIIFHQYFKIRNFLKTIKVLRPSSLYSAAKLVDFLTPIRTQLAYKANAKNSCYIKQQFTVLKARVS